MSDQKNTSPQNGGAMPRANNTVWVACKLPHGVVIRDHVKGTFNENVLGGGTRPVDIFRPVGPKIRIKGPTVPREFVRLVEVVGGYAITAGVPADVFVRWMEWNKDAPAVRNKLIFGHENRDRVLSWAKDHSAVRSGIEPLDVSMKSQNGRMVYSDERVSRAGADQVVDDKVAITA